MLIEIEEDQVAQILLELKSGKTQNDATRFFIRQMEKLLQDKKDIDEAIEKEDLVRLEELRHTVLPSHDRYRLLRAYHNLKDRKEE